MANSVLLFARDHTRSGQRLQSHIEQVVPTQNLEAVHDFESLSRRLHRRLQNPAVAVLYAETREDLARVLSLRDLIVDIRLILILPDQSRETVKAGHRLRPRYVDYQDSDFSDVKKVLEKMLQRFCLSDGDRLKPNHS